MPKRSKVKLYEQIRKVHEREQLSVRELSKRFHDSAWDPRVLLTLETRMEHGYQEWCAAGVAEVPG